MVFINTPFIRFGLNYNTEIAEIALYYVSLWYLKIYDNTMYTFLIHYRPTAGWHFER